MLRAYKYRIYPTDEQKVMLAKTFGCCRYAYNWALEQKERIYKESGVNIGEFDMTKRVRNELRGSAPWMKEVSSKAIEYAIADLFNAYNKFFEGTAEKPKNRCKHQRQHYHDRGAKPGIGIKADFKHSLITIPKIKNIPCVFHRRFKGNIKQVGVELLTSGRYNVSILVEDGKKLPAKPSIDSDKTIGIDTGLKHFAVLSDGQIFEPMYTTDKEKRKKKLLQRRLSKKKVGSRQFQVLKRRFAKFDGHIANRRHDYINKITHYLACENQATTICVEDLNIEGMKHNKHLAYSVSEACLGEFYRQLEYKCRWVGKNYIVIDRWAPSSQRCSHCGFINKSLKLNEREWTCPVCGTHHDRDLNAAYNIKHFGLSVNETLPSVRRKVKPVEQPLVDDRSSKCREHSLDPKKPCCCASDRRVRTDKWQPSLHNRSTCRADEAGKVKGSDASNGKSYFAPMPHFPSTIQIDSDMTLVSSEMDWNEVNVVVTTKP